MASLSSFKEQPSYSVYVGNLPDGIRQSHVEGHIFVGLGVESVRLVKDRETDKFRGFAYVDMKTEADYKEALTRDGTMLNNRPIRVTPSNNRKNQNNRGGARGGSGAPVGGGNYSNNGAGGQRGGYENSGRGGGSGNFRDSARPNYVNNTQRNWREDNPRNGRTNSPRYSQNPISSQNSGPSNNPGNGPRRSNFPGNFQNRGGNTSSRNTISTEEFKYIDDPNRPRIKIKDPEAILNASINDNLADKFKRDVSIFGEGKPREASPVRVKGAEVKELPSL